MLYFYHNISKIKNQVKKSGVIMNTTISNEAIQARRKYQREWREKNKSRVREYNVRYWENRVLKKLQATENGVNREQ